MFCSSDIPSIVLPIAYQSADLRRYGSLDSLLEDYHREMYLDFLVIVHFNTWHADTV